ncbi:MAG: DUF2062 domain-containing protein [Cyanophyceae cyanobacterium]
MTVKTRSRIKHKRRSWGSKPLRYWYIRLRRLRGKPQVIARGIAAGVFAGFFPFFGFQTIIGVLLAVLLRGNKIAAAAGTWISNPLTYVPIYYFNFRIGKLLLGGSDLLVEDLDIQSQSWSAIVESGTMVVATLLVGCLAVGLVGSICSYFVSLWAIARWRNSRQLKKRQLRYRKKN